MHRILRSLFPLSALLCLFLETCFLHSDTWLENLVVDDYYYPYFCSDCEGSRLALEADYLYWQIEQPSSRVPFVFAGPYDSNITPTLNTDETNIVLGNSQRHNPWQSGAKMTVKYDFEGPCLWDMEISYAFLGKNTFSKNVRSNDFKDDKVTNPSFPDDTYLAIPFFDVTNGKESSAYIAKPNVYSGKATLTTQRWMQNVEWNFTAKLPICNCDWLLKGLMGFRYWNFNDELKFTTSSPNLVRSDIFKTRDKFQTINSFYGAQIGMCAGYGYQCFSFLIKAKLALGAIDQRLCINGRLLSNDFNGFSDVRSYQGGYFALPTNIGYCDQWEFAYLPEVNVQFNYQLSRCFSLNIGYSCLYINRTLWAENQINPIINETQSLAITRDPYIGLTGVSQPKAHFKSNDFWAHGLNVGFDFHF